MYQQSAPLNYRAELRDTGTFKEWREDLAHDLNVWLKHPETQYISQKCHEFGFCYNEIGFYRNRQDQALPTITPRQIDSRTSTKKDKLKFFRIRLPPYALPTPGAYYTRDWIVLRWVRPATFWDTVPDIGSAPDPEAGRSRYYIIAFPVEAVEAIRSVFFRTQMQWATLVTFKTHGVVPIMTGRNFTHWSLDPWLQACHDGIGSLKIVSEDPLPLDYVLDEDDHIHY